MASLPFKLDKKTIALILSLILNVLTGSGTVSPLIGDDSVCPPSPPAPASTAPSPPSPPAN